MGWRTNYQLWYYSVGSTRTDTVFEKGSILGSASWMLDLVVAPNFTSEAYDQLSKRAGRSVITYDIEDDKINDYEYRL